MESVEEAMKGMHMMISVSWKKSVSSQGGRFHMNRNNWETGIRMGICEQNNWEVCKMEEGIEEIRDAINEFDGHRRFLDIELKYTQRLMNEE